MASSVEGELLPEETASADRGTEQAEATEGQRFCGRSAASVALPEHAQSFLVLLGAEFASRVPLV